MIVTISRSYAGYFVKSAEQELFHDLWHSICNRPIPIWTNPGNDGSEPVGFAPLPVFFELRVRQNSLERGCVCRVNSQITESLVIKKLASLYIQQTFGSHEIGRFFDTPGTLLHFTVDAFDFLALSIGFHGKFGYCPGEIGVEARFRLGDSSRPLP